MYFNWGVVQNRYIFTYFFSDIRRANIRKAFNNFDITPVSYTHLTLPTSDLV